MSFLPSIIVLGLVALLAIRLATTRELGSGTAADRRAAAILLAVATAVQAVHFVEEAATGFHERFPALLGLPPMPFSGFVAFNLAWIVIWIVSIPGLRAIHKGAYFAAWFLAIAGLLNGVAHPLMAAAVGGYFPGLITSPFIGVAGVLLWQRLQRATAVTAGQPFA